MITPDELIRIMRAALADEREGIRRLDARAVTRANAAKNNVLYWLRSASDADRPALDAALHELSSEMHSNLVLLMHAGAYLRQAAELSRTPSGLAEVGTRAMTPG
jgi:hypothetical protein